MSEPGEYKRGIDSQPAPSREVEIEVPSAYGGPVSEPAALDLATIRERQREWWRPQHDDHRFVPGVLVSTKERDALIDAWDEVERCRAENGNLRLLCAAWVDWWTSGEEDILGAEVLSEKSRAALGEVTQ